MTETSCKNCGETIETKSAVGASGTGWYCNETCQEDKLAEERDERIAQNKTRAPSKRRRGRFYEGLQTT